ncbi:hypothetical protein VYU27_004170 [Nannochloropsis oceanica]
MSNVIDLATAGASGSPGSPNRCCFVVVGQGQAVLPRPFRIKTLADTPARGVPAHHANTPLGTYLFTYMAAGMRVGVASRPWRPSMVNKMDRRRWMLFVLLCVARPAAAKEGDQNPMVYDGGSWHDLDENMVPGESQPYPPVSDSWQQPETSIHVQISSFRDHRCPKTLYNLFTKAKYPDRVHAGVVQQNSEGDVDCLFKYCQLMTKELGQEPKKGNAVPGKSRLDPFVLENCPYVDQIKIMRVSAEEAKGPTYGRYLGSKLIGDEEFCMQTDAHMDFLFEWDTLLLDMWRLTQNEYGVLSTYVPRFEEMGLNANDRWEVPHICRVFFTPGDGMPRNEQAKAAMWLTRPKMTSTWAAGFAFNKCHADKRTPYDPHLPSLFDGEEYSRFARLWTRGYDVYTPHRSVVYHDYNHGPDTSVTSSWSRRGQELQRSRSRLNVLLGYKDAPVARNSTGAHDLMGKWDLGTRRSLAQLIDFTGVDTINREVIHSSCQRLAWVPFERPGEGIDDDIDPFHAQRLLGERQQGQLEENSRLTPAMWKSWSAKTAPWTITILWLAVAVLQ